MKSEYLENSFVKKIDIIENRLFRFWTMDQRRQYYQGYWFKLGQIENWLIENEMKHKIFPDMIELYNEQDAAVFKLKWI